MKKYGKNIFGMLSHLLSIGNGVIVLSFLGHDEVDSNINRSIQPIFKQFNFLIPDEKQKLTAYLYECLIRIKQMQPSKHINCDILRQKINERKNHTNIYFLYLTIEEIADLFIEEEFIIDPQTGFKMSLDGFPILPPLVYTKKSTVLNLKSFSLEELQEIPEDIFNFNVKEIERYRYKNNDILYKKWNAFWNDVTQIKNNKILSLL